MKAKRRTISMEEYMDYSYSGKQTDLTVDILRQIIHMHGFKKTNHPKSVLMEALNAMELMDPSRSTLKENISPSASIALENIVEDLKNLDWQECCVTSIKTLSSLPEKDKQKHSNSVHHSNLGKSYDNSKSTVSSAGDINRIGDTSPPLLSYCGAKTDAKGSQCEKKRKRSLTKGINSSCY